MSPRSIRLVQRADEHVRHGRLETGKSDRDPVLAWRDLHGSGRPRWWRAGQRLSGTREFDDDGGKREWRTVGNLEHASGNDGGACANAAADSARTMKKTNKRAI